MRFACAAPDCTNPVAFGVFACHAHWGGLPREIRGAISRAWVVRRGHPESHAAEVLHERAKQRAVEWWTTEAVPAR